MRAQFERGGVKLCGKHRSFVGIPALDAKSELLRDERWQRACEIHGCPLPVRPHARREMKSFSPRAPYKLYRACVALCLNCARRVGFLFLFGHASTVSLCARATAPLSRTSAIIIIAA